MKYEKFEEWMIGKKVRHSSGGIGVVSSIHCIVGDVYAILVEFTDGEIWCSLDHLEFLEEKPSEESSAQKDHQIDWQVGQTVWDIRNGRGIVKEVSDDEYYPIYVVFDLTDRYGDAVSDTYTPDGRYVETQKNRSLFFSEPVITAELYPPKKPFTPTLKKGDTVVAKRKDGRNTVVFYVVDEYEGVVKSSGAAYSKSDWVFYKLGEEVKFQ